MSAPPPAASATPIVDAYGRRFTYLRISVTDHCNLRCVYCMPEEGVPWLPKDEILSYEEIARVVEAAAACGVHKIRLTGGEPLTRRELPRLVEMIAAIPGIDDLALTTNGVLLAQQAKALRAAGLRRVNVSLDTLDAEKFERIARGGSLQSVLDGIAEAQKVGLGPIKVNCVVLGGLNDDEAARFAELTAEQAIEMRFIEYMPLEEAKGCAMGSGNFSFVGNDVTKRRVEARFGALEAMETGGGMRGPAEVWRIPGAAGRLGFISAMSAPFCAKCDRLRLTATGEVRSCLLDGGGLDLRALLRGGGTREQLLDVFRRAAHLKPEVHKAWDQIPSANMSRIGG